jgi:hypothetical protein
MKKALLSVVLFTFINIAWSEEISYRKHIKPIFDTKYVSCHGSDSVPEYYAFKEEKEKWMARGLE